MRRALFALLLVLAAGCGASNGDGDDDDDDDDDAATTTPEMPDTIDVAATDVLVSLPFGVTVTGTASGLVTDVAISANTGTIAIEGTSLAIAFYEKQPWPEFGYTLYQGIAVGASRWDVIWLYCDAGGLAYVWYEGMTGIAIDYVEAAGTCADTNASTQTAVSLPALTLATPAAVPGFEIDGENVVLADGESGLLSVGGDALPFVPFSVVDCTECGGEGWYELHSVVWDEANARAIFVILYLDFGYPDRVLATYARSIPDFADPIDILDLEAAWSTPP